MSAVQAFAQGSSVGPPTCPAAGHMAQRRGLRDKRKELERRQKAYLLSAEDNDKQAGNQQKGDARAELRRSAEAHRKEAAALEPERQDVDRRLAALERPIGEATARLDAAKAELLSYD